MLRADFHTHTTYCDGKNTPREMVEAAYKMGIEDFGISGHADFSFCEPGFGMSDRILEKYRDELEKLREEYHGKMNLYIGIELDCLGPEQRGEYAIGSTHCVKKNNTFISVDNTEEELVNGVKHLWKGDWYAFARDYFELEASITDRMNCTWIGHFDLLTKFNEGGKHFDENCDDYLEPALAAMRKLNADGIPFEINMGAVAKKYRTAPYPSRTLLKELHDMGGQIIVNSDSHSIDTIGYHFDEALRLAAECGFTHTLVLTPGSGFRKVEI